MTDVAVHDKMEIDAPPEEPEKIEGDKDDEDLEAGSVSTKVVALPKEPIDLRFKNLPVGIKARQVPCGFPPMQKTIRIEQCASLSGSPSDAQRLQPSFHGS